MESFKKKRGFSIIELVVSIFIITLIGAGMLLSNSKYGENVLLTNLAYDVAITIREAQSYGLSTKEWKTSVDLENRFKGGYGIRFASIDSGSIAGNKAFLLFYDSYDPVNLNNWHCGEDGENPTTLSGCRTSAEFLKEYKIGGRSRIKSFCVKDNSNNQQCFNFVNGSGGLTYMDLVFRRPSYYVCIYTNTNSNCTTLKEAEVTLMTSEGFTRKIFVNSIGQISVQ